MASTSNEKPTATAPQKPTLSASFMDAFGKPLFWIAVGYGLGFFHGNTSGKRKALPPA